MIERRKPSKSGLKSSRLPSDYIAMVTEVFSTNFDAGLKALSKIKPEPRFEASGEIFADEVVLQISLHHGDQIVATTVRASVDFDPKASAPTVQDLLAACVDAIGALYGQLLNPEDPSRLEQLADESLAALDDVPFDWTPLTVERHKIFLKIDKSNPKLDDLADEWLTKNDPNAAKREAEEAEEVEKLFVTGPKGPQKGGSGSGTVH